MNPFSKEEGFFCFKGFKNPFSEKRNTFYNMIRNNFEISNLISIFLTNFNICIVWIFSHKDL